jgi:hypothetical protein
MQSRDGGESRPPSVGPTLRSRETKSTATLRVSANTPARKPGTGVSTDEFRPIDGVARDDTWIDAEIL